MVTDTFDMLQATGFATDVAQRYREHERAGRTDDCLRLLRQRRCELVEALHEAQRPLDIIDYAIWDLTRSTKDS